MKRTKLILSMLCIFILSFYACYTPSYAGQDSTGNAAPAPVLRLAEHTIKELSKNSEFANFIDSNLHIMPLGPGTHSFLVHVLQGKDIAGYLIITGEQSSAEEMATPQIKYLVTEYGVGTFSVFNPELLYLLGHLSHLEKGTENSTPHQMKYAGKLSYWVIEKEGKTIYVDATNGDVLLDNPEMLTEPRTIDRYSDWISTDHTLKTIQQTSPLFDSSENLKWRVSTPVPIFSERSLLRKLDTSKQLIFNSSDHNMWYSGPLSITGYATWTNPDSDYVSFLRIGTNESLIRYIPVKRLLENGNFYENTK
ncbi:hypothetical protein [Paenibacillus gallinarum]|uniref:Lipoprotein n=1 Tax=Paenibacillus gallinarum TaxID=2762232 RepID=A0ABR8SUD2_9BACL|nr:hypothetical protein [Paenibacillus gallinarum]MBD7967098.1 hypothetical protein [Paenibacillus gallinarum]